MRKTDFTERKESSGEMNRLGMSGKFRSSYSGRGSFEKSGVGRI